jgi:hypothetical protein
MPETTQTTIRLTGEDRENIDKIISTGAATNVSEAIRVALADKAAQVGTVPHAMSKLSLDRLKSMAAMDPVKWFTTRHEAERELLRRGYVPNGIGNWELPRPEPEKAPDFSKTFISVDELTKASASGGLPKWAQEAIDRHATAMNDALSLRDAITPPSGRAPRR